MLDSNSPQPGTIFMQPTNGYIAPLVNPMTITNNNISAGAIVTVLPYPNITVGDTVSVYWGIHTPSQPSIVNDITMSIPVTITEALIRNMLQLSYTHATVTYIINVNTQPQKGISPSTHVTIDLSGNTPTDSDYPKPSIQETTDSTLDSRKFPNGVTVVIAPYLNKQAHDNVTMHWNGSSVNGSIDDSIWVGKSVIGESIYFPIPAQYLTANAGGTVKITYEVMHEEETTTTSSVELDLNIS